jgi:hypothetical protein
MMSNETLSLADVLGPWQQPDWDSGLIEQCRLAWSTPFRDLTDGQLAMLIRQDFAVTHLLPIARARLKAAKPDDTELYDGELQSTVDSATDAA